MDSLEMAARDNDFEEVKRLFTQQPADANPQDKTVMHAACGTGNLEMVQWLHAKGVALKTRTTMGREPMHDACGSGNLELVKWMQSQGVSIDVSNDFGINTMHVACKSGNLDCVRFLHSEGASLTDMDSGGGTPIMCAAAGACSSSEEASLAVVKWLHEKGVCLESKNNRGMSVIEYSVMGEKHSITEWLLGNPKDSDTTAAETAATDEDEWQQCYDPTHQKLYYVNTRTQESSWTKPTPRLAPEQTKAPGTWIGFSDWQEVSDPASGHKYFFNHVTKESTWNDPRQPEQAPTSAVTSLCFSEEATDFGEEVVITGGGKEATFDSAGTALLTQAGPGSTVRLKLTQHPKGDPRVRFACVGVIRPAEWLDLDDTPEGEGAFTVTSGGTRTVECDPAFDQHPCFGVGDILEVAFAADGASFGWKVNGAVRIPMADIPPDPSRVICVGGDEGTQWAIV
jgi:hypothetical protein